MTWHIEHKDGRTRITHNGKEVKATVLDFHAEVGSMPTAKMQVVFLNEDKIDLQIEEVNVVGENADTLAELQEANDEVTRLRRLVIDNTCATDGGKKYWPQWVVNGLIGPLPGEGGE